MTLDLGKFYQACSPSPLDVGNSEARKYYIDFSSVRGGNIIGELRRTITRLSPDEPTCQLFTGHIGCGKTTELQRLKADLEQQEFHVVYFEASQVLEMADVDVTDILLAIARHVSESLEAVQIKLKPGYFVNLFREVGEILQTPVEIRDRDFSVGIAKISAKTKDSPKLRSQLRQYLEPRTSGILEAINQEILMPARNSLMQRGYRGLVVIIDNLDRLDNSVKPTGQIQPEYLFVERGEQLKQLNCHVVYTIPLILNFSYALGRLINRFGRQPQPLPMVPVQLRSGSECKEGMALLQQMVLARAFPDVNPVARIDLILEVFDSPEALERLCQASGGHVRNLLILLSRCLERDDPPLTLDCIEVVIRQRRNELSLAITEDVWTLLREVAQQKSLRGEERYQLLVRDMFVFEYRDSEGSWFDINPILAETKEFHEYLASSNVTTLKSSQPYNTDFAQQEVSDSPSPDLVNLGRVQPHNTEMVDTDMVEEVSEPTSTDLVEQEVQSPNTYRLVFSAPRNPVPVGQRICLQVELQPDTSGHNTLELPDGIAELYCFISADGLRVLGAELVTMPIDPETGHPVAASFELQAHLRGERTYTIELFVEDPESGKLSIYKHSDRIIVKPPEATEDRPPILPALNIPIAPKSDFVLLVETDLPNGDTGDHHLSYYLTSRLRNLKLRNQPVGNVVLRADDIARMRSLLAKTRFLATNVQPEDARETMISLGTYLFDWLFPADTTTAFRDTFWQVADQISTWLITEDGITWLPWELVVPYRDEDNTIPLRFLSERYHLARWIQGLGTTLYSEVPLGEIALTHYKILDSEQQKQDEELIGWEQLLNAYSRRGIRQVVNPETPFYGLHLLLHEDELNRRDIVVRDETTPATSPEEEVPKARLDLRLKRPIVTFTILSQNTSVPNTTDDWLLLERVLPFLRTGASAVVGSWWPTSEAAERVFWSHFYELLARRLPLGEVVWRSRLAVERALPHSPDWLAYSLFGDPRAKPYWPELSSGYSALECLNPDEPFRPGKTYYFRASVRSRPPAWYQDRLLLAEELSNQLRALFMAPGLQTTFPEPIEMQLYGRAMRQATIPLTPPKEGDYPLFVQLMEGEEQVKTLQLTLQVREVRAGGQPNG